MQFRRPSSTALHAATQVSLHAVIFLLGLQSHMNHRRRSEDCRGPVADEHSGAPQGVSAMRDGAVWSSCDDALLGMGLLKWGRSHAAIAADLLPGHTPSQVAQRMLERTHRNRAANPVKVAF